MEDHPPRRGEPWHDAAELLGLAHDLLGTHIGPNRERLSPFAPDQDDLDAFRYALSRVGHLALRATAGSTTEQKSDRLVTVATPAYELVTRLGPVVRAGSLADLEPRALRPPDPDPDAVVAATDTLRYLRQLVYPAVRRWQPTTTAAVKFTTMAAYLGHTALLRRPGTGRDHPELRASCARLARVGATLAARPTVTPAEPHLQATATDAAHRLRDLTIPAGTATARLATAARTLGDDVHALVPLIPRAELPRKEWATRLGRRLWAPPPDPCVPTAPKALP
jgi:hypothetical protein